MKKFILFFVIIIGIFPMNNIYASKVRAFLSYATFYSPEQGPYIETYLVVMGKSVMFKKNEKNTYQGKLKITMLFKQGDLIKKFKKYELLSPEVSDSTKINVNFIDQQRFSLPNGSYLFEMLISDSNCDTIPFSVSQPLEINYNTDSVFISGIQLIEKYKKTKESNILSKSGYDFIPYVSDYFPENMDTIAFYTEIYNTNKGLGADQKYLLCWDIESFETGKVINDFIRYKKENAQGINVLFNQFNIKELPSGNYYLAIKLKDQNNKIVASNKLFFQRNNPNVQLNFNDISSLSIENTFVAAFTNKDTLLDYIYSLTPISTGMEKTFVFSQLKKSDITIMQQYFYNFWKKRDELEPEKAWENYHILVMKVNDTYSTGIRKGYDTDRGRIYLEYGMPDVIIAKPFGKASVGGNAVSLPYEIWKYHKLGENQRNRKFVFCNSDMAHNTYELIHSDADGELKNYNWSSMMYRGIYNNVSASMERPMGESTGTNDAFFEEE